jgi:hypothetical protein
VSTVSDSGGMDGLRRPGVSSRGNYTQSVRGQAVHFFCQLVATVIGTGKVWKLVGTVEAHMRRTHARAGAISVCDVPSTHPCHLVSTLLHAGAHILEAHIPGAHMPGRSSRSARLGAHMQGARPDTNLQIDKAAVQHVGDFVPTNIGSIY